ncbi:MAG: hypothetical protein AAF600_11485 [Bacteroidota bacterium]
MKKTLFLLLVIATCSAVCQDRPKTLIGNDPEEISGFGSVLFSFTTIDGDLSTLSGGGGAVLLDNSFYIGGYGLGLTGNNDLEMDGNDYSTSFGHGGFWLGYNINPVDLIHFGIDTKLGWGRIKTRSNAIIDGKITDDVFIFNPSGFVEANINYWFKINAGVGFQKTFGVDSDIYGSSDFDGPTFNISLLFGWFN